MPHAMLRDRPPLLHFGWEEKTVSASLFNSSRKNTIKQKKTVPADWLEDRPYAPRVGFEPTTCRLTAGCSTIELPRKVAGTRLISVRRVWSINLAH